MRLPALVTLSTDSRLTTGVLMIAFLAVELGGLLVLRLSRGDSPATDFQKAAVRAAYAHGAVLIILAMVGQIYVDAARLGGVGAEFGRDGVWIAAILVPAGFLLSARAPGATEPDRWFGLVYLGGVAVASSVLAIGIALLSA
jgi:hypothetical protein